MLHMVKTGSQKLTQNKQGRGQSPQTREQGERNL